MSIIIILFSFIMQIELKNIRIKQDLELREKNICLLEAISNELTYNTSYSELINLSDSGKKYMGNANISIENIKSNKVIDFFTVEMPKEKPYIVMEIDNGKVLKINTKIYFKYINKEEMIECQSFKGNY